MTKESEALVQSRIRLEAAARGVRLWRNNVGVLRAMTQLADGSWDENPRPVRFGLANESAQLNKVLKSSDLIGWRAVLITPAHVGTTIAQIVARECKPSDWVPAPPTDVRRFEHEQAQLAWINLVNADGGDAAFATGEGTL